MFEKILEKIAPTPERRVEIDFYWKMKYIKPGEGIDRGVRLKSRETSMGPVIFSIIVNAPIVSLDRNGIETPRSRVRRLTAPLQRFREVVCPRPITSAGLMNLVPRGDRGRR